MNKDRELAYNQGWGSSSKLLPFLVPGPHLPLGTAGPVRSPNFTLITDTVPVPDPDPLLYKVTWHLASRIVI